MRLCINPYCSPNEWENPDTAENCEHCGGNLTIDNSYSVRRLLSNHSGFGTIYELVDTADRPKVLKVLKPEFNEEPRTVALFQQEVHLLQQLNAPSLPKIDAYIHHQLPDGQILHGIVMEKIVGCNLLEWLEHRGHQPISQAMAIAWLRQIVTTLDLVHQQNYFHRDIKPSNIMLDDLGRLVLIDFGSARQESYTYLDKLYGNGGITQIASCGYTPPEQERGFAVPQSDFYALGMTFIHLVTGKYPLNLHDPQTDTYLWREFAPQITPALAALLDYLTAIPPIDRPLDCANILHCLDEIEFVPPVQIVDPTPKPSQRLDLVWIGIGMAIVSSIGYGIGAYYRLFPSPFPQTAPASSQARADRLQPGGSIAPNTSYDTSTSSVHRLRLTT